MAAATKQSEKKQGSSPGPNPLKLSKSDCVYTKCYCEENIWKLCELVRNSRDAALLKSCNAVFISNKTRSIPIWHQQSSANPPVQPVVWDYHVILVFADGRNSCVYDLDSVLPFPTPFPDYLALGFRDDDLMKPNYKRVFRVIEATEYLDKFASDRSHMKRKDGTFKMPPPSYPCLAARDGNKNNIQEFINMETNFCGKVMDIRDFGSHFLVA